MNHDAAFLRNRLGGLRLQAHRGQLDAILADAEPPLAAAIRATLERRIRQLADAIESGEG